MASFQSVKRLLTAKSRIFRALVLRFVISRYGRDNLGFLWTVAEPMMLCLGVMVIWSFTKGTYEHGIDLVAFVYTGYMPLTLWRHQTGLMVNMLRVLKFLTMFKGVSLFDALMTRLMLEFISVSGASIIVFALLYGFNTIKEPYDLGLMLQGWLLMGFMASGAGLMIASASETTDIVEKIVPPIQYFLLPISGCFYMVDWLPDAVKGYALYMPMVHCYEMIRSGYFGPSIPTNYDAFYAFCWGMAMIGLGCFFFERIKDHVEA